MAGRAWTLLSTLPVVLLWLGGCQNRYPRESEGALLGVQLAVNEEPGDQTDAHLSGDWIAYSSERRGGSQVRYHNLVTGLDEPLPGEPGMDFLADFQGSVLLFTRLRGGGSSVMSYDLASGLPPVELAPQGGVNRREPVMGGHTVVWQDFDLSPGLLGPELVAYDLNSHALTQLTSDALLDKDPALSPDGTLVVWTKCQKDGSGCAVWRAQYANGGWTSSPVTGPEVEAFTPDTNGSRIAYALKRRRDGKTEATIAWQSVNGGEASELVFAGESRNPILAHRLLGFEHRDPHALNPNWDIYAYDLNTSELFRLTDTPDDEALNDITILPEGQVTVAWTTGVKDYNVDALVFPLRTFRCTAGTPIQSCDRPGRRPLLMTAASGATLPAFAATPGEGMVCVDSLGPQARKEVKVELNGARLFVLKAASEARQSLESRVSLRATNTIALEGPKGAKLRVYGRDPGCHAEPLPALAGALPGRAFSLMSSPATRVDGARHFLPQAASPRPVQSCSAGPGEGVTAWAMAALMGAAHRRRRGSTQKGAPTTRS